jgi:hypothetical protein
MVHPFPIAPPPRLHVALALRALDVARDREVGEEEGAEHLARLAGYRDRPLERALVHLHRHEVPSAYVDRASRLLALAIAEIDRHQIHPSKAS